MELKHSSSKQRPGEAEIWTTTNKCVDATICTIWDGVKEIEQPSQNQEHLENPPLWKNIVPNFKTSRTKFKQRSHSSVLLLIGIGCANSQASLRSGLQQVLCSSRVSNFDTCSHFWDTTFLQFCRRLWWLWRIGNLSKNCEHYYTLHARRNVVPTKMRLYSAFRINLFHSHPSVIYWFSFILSVFLLNTALLLSFAMTAVLVGISILGYPAQPRTLSLYLLNIHHDEALLSCCQHTYCFRL